MITILPRVEKEPKILYFRHCENRNCLFCQMFKAYFHAMSEILTLHKIAIIHRITNCENSDSHPLSITGQDYSNLKPPRSIEEIHADFILPLILP